MYVGVTKTPCVLIGGSDHKRSNAMTSCWSKKLCCAITWASSRRYWVRNARSSDLVILLCLSWGWVEQYLCGCHILLFQWHDCYRYIRRNIYSYVYIYSWTTLVYLLIWCLKLLIAQIMVCNNCFIIMDYGTRNQHSMLIVFIHILRTMS